MTLIDDRFKRRLMLRLLDAGKRRARPKIARASRTLARALSSYVVFRSGRYPNVEGYLEIPHYWAVYVHDGRNPFRKQRYMIWWRNPLRDPRLRGGKTPERASQLRSLTRAEWIAANKENRDHLRRGGDPFDMPVIITKVIRRRTPAVPFFDNDSGGGMSGFSTDASRIAQSEFSRHVARTVPGVGQALKDEAVARI